jgi:hypothetical protein
MQEIIRSLGFYQPFCSLMLHGKKETRWVRVGKKPPFPLGKYVLYSTLKPCSNAQLFDWCGPEIMSSIIDTLKVETTKDANGFALCTGELVNIRPMTVEDEKEAFVLSKGIQVRKDEEGNENEYMQWILEFENVERINQFYFKGKQGVGILTDEQKEKLNSITTVQVCDATDAKENYNCSVQK